MKKNEEKKKTSSVLKVASTKKKASIGKRNKQRGNEYERRIANELNELGFDVVTSRSESKTTDNNKVDLIDRSNKLPVQIQLKRSIATPSYFKIREDTTVPDEQFCLIWNKQRNVNGRFLSTGECVILDKKMFYELIKHYANE